MTSPTGSTNSKFRVLTKETELVRFKSLVRMNWHHLINLNPKVLRSLSDTTTGVFSHVVLMDMDEEGTEAAIAVAAEDDPNALPLMFAKSHRTAKLRLTLLMTKYPMLRVPRGRVRCFPVSLRQEGDLGYLVLDLKNSTVEVSPRSKKGQTGSQSAEPATKAAPAVTAEPGAKAEPVGKAESVTNAQPATKAEPTL